jgi:hypothetical protein
MLRTLADLLANVGDVETLPAKVHEAALTTAEGRTGRESTG